jgi:peptide chain release factor 1
MFGKLDDVEVRYEELNTLLCDPEVIGNRERYQKLSKEQADLSSLVETYRLYRAANERIEDNKQLINDPELRDLAREEHRCEATCAQNPNRLESVAEGIRC